MSPRQQKIIEYLAEHQPMTTAELAAAFEVQHHVIRNALFRLTQSNMVENIIVAGRGQSSRSALWSVKQKVEPCTAEKATSAGRDKMSGVYLCPELVTTAPSSRMEAYRLPSLINGRRVFPTTHAVPNDPTLPF